MDCWFFYEDVLFGALLVVYEDSLFVNRWLFMKICYLCTKHARWKWLASDALLFVAPQMRSCGKALASDALLFVAPQIRSCGKGLASDALLFVAPQIRSCGKCLASDALLSVAPQNVRGK